MVKKENEINNKHRNELIAEKYIVNIEISTFVRKIKHITGIEKVLKKIKMSKKEKLYVKS